MSTLAPSVVLEIDADIRAAKLTHKEIAVNYKTTSKTISRIANGQTWQQITGRPKKPVDRDPRLFVAPADINTQVSVILRELKGRSKKGHRLLSVFRSEWGFLPDITIRHATYETWDGIDRLATDGIIAWSIPAVVDLAQGLHRLGLGGELPTFTASTMMSWPIERCVKVIAQRGNALILDRAVGLDLRFARLAAKHRLEVRWAGEQRNILYLTRAKSKRSVDTNSVAVACVATMELAMSEKFAEIDIEKTTVEIGVRNRAERDEKKLVMILKTIKESVGDSRKLLTAIFIDTLRARNYAITQSGAEIVEDILRLGSETDLIESVEDTAGIIDNDDLDSVFMAVGEKALELGCWPFDIQPKFSLFAINDAR